MRPSVGFNLFGWTTQWLLGPDDGAPQINPTPNPWVFYFFIFGVVIAVAYGLYEVRKLRRAKNDRVKFPSARKAI